MLWKPKVTFNPVCLAESTPLNAVLMPSNTLNAYKNNKQLITKLNNSKHRNRRSWKTSKSEKMCFSYLKKGFHRIPPNVLEPFSPLMLVLVMRKRFKATSPSTDWWWEVTRRAVWSAGWAHARAVRCSWGLRHCIPLTKLADSSACSLHRKRLQLVLHSAIAHCLWWVLTS